MLALMTLDEFRTSLVGALFGTVLIVGLWHWFRLMTDRERIDRLRDSLQSPRPAEKPITGAVTALCGCAWILSLMVVWQLISLDRSTTDSADQSLTSQQLLVYTIVQASLQTLLMFGVMVFATKMGRIRWRDCGFRSDQIQEQVTAGMLGFAMAMPIVFLFIMLTAVFRTPDNAHQFIQMMAKSPSVLNYLMIGFSVIILAPLAEELLFRVCMQGLFQQRNPLLAIMVTSLVFALVHGFPDSISLVPLALILGTVYYYYNSYIACVVLHAAFNGFMFLLSLLDPTGM
ncbi:MAG: hypothetical protein CMJ46_02400 [Planctomyces sp.]|nr:hypothetical protein [Planctomyces sp.]